MDQPKDLSAAETRPSMSPDVRISVTNFGPIAEGTIDLRPLTVFVGPSNTGKTYFAVLIYALHRVLSGLSRFPFMDWLSDFWPAFRLGKFAAETMWEEELQDVLEKLDTEGRPFRFSDLPESVRDVMQTALEQPSLLGRELWTEFGRCFDLESVLDLIRSSGCINRAEVSLEVSEEAHSLWRLRMGISESDIITMDGQIEDMLLFPGRGAISEFKSGQIFRALVKERGELSLTRNRGESFENFFRILLYLVDSANRSEAHYLPAARSGIMQIHRVIASSAVARSTRTPLEPSELPTLSGVMADFIQRLILYNESRAPDQLMRNLADALERETLTGQIRTKPSSSGGYPEFVYRPLETERGRSSELRFVYGVRARPRRVISPRRRQPRRHAPHRGAGSASPSSSPDSDGSGSGALGPRRGAGRRHDAQRLVAPGNRQPDTGRGIGRNGPANPRARNPFRVRSAPMRWASGCFARMETQPAR